MSTHPIYADDMTEIVESFVIESREIFESLDNDLIRLEKTPDDHELVDKIFRAVHTVKGTAGFLSLEQLSALSHLFEDVLNKLRRDELAFHPKMMDVMFDAFDMMRVLVDQVETRNLEEVDLGALLDCLKDISAGTFDPARATATAPAAQAAPPEAAAPPEPEPEPDTQHPIFEEGMEEIVESFVVEAVEILDTLDNELIQLERTPDDKDLVDRIFRAVHTVKGTSGFLSLEQLSVLSHHFEDVLNKLRRDELAFRPDMTDVLFAAFDRMKAFVQQVVDRKVVKVDISGLIANLESISNGTYVAAEAAPNTPAPAPAQAPASDAGAPSTDEAEPAADGDADEGQAARPGEGPARRRNERTTETIRVEVDRLDTLLNLVGELVLGRNRLLQLVGDMMLENEADEMTRELNDTSAHVDFITTELQTAIMHTRMIQIGRVFNKFPRVVRDLAKEFDKHINLVIEGEETELDKSLVEEIGDPLVHLVRNAADHGIEHPDVREAAGKPREGTLRLAASHEGNHIVIVIEDDGAGMDPERLKQSAISKGIATKKEVAEMSDADAFNLIFRPGFSTAKQVSKVSGRGVGMDVVKTNITRLNGTVNIESEMGKGTRFILKLPLTLAIIQSLLVRTHGETYAIPLHSVIEVVGLADDDIQTIRGREVIRLREQVLPLMRIGNVLNANAEGPSRRSYAVIVGIAHHRLGLVVDDLVGQKEIVIKPLGSYLKKIPGLAGSTILGDGRVIMILDIGELLRMENDKRRKPAKNTLTEAA